MSKDYTQVVDRVVEVLEAERTDTLSEDLTTPVVAIEKGQYVPGSTASKPTVYVRLHRAGVIAEMAGGTQRLERMKLAVSGAVVADTQEAAQNEAMNLVANLERVLVNYPTDVYWGASRLGWSYSDEDDRDEPVMELTPEPGADRSVVHFMLLWSCDVRISTYAL